MKSIIQQNLHDVQSRIQHAEQQYGRGVDTVKLLAVSKTVSAENIRIAYQAGQQSFGENYLQEALAKQQLLSDLNIEWHFIGHVQSNKTRSIAEHFAWVHTISRVDIAARLSKQRPPHLPPLNLCIQVNIGGESSKDGILPEEVMRLGSQIINLPNLRWRGLMTIPAPTTDEKQQRHQFAELRALFESLKVIYPTLDTLSMGMSADLEAAVAEGATIVRIGTAIFGERGKK